MRTIKQNSRNKILSAIAATASLISFSSVHSAVIVTAGTLDGIGGSTVTKPSAAVVADYGSTQSDGTIHMMLDLGSVQYVTLLNIINRGDTATNLAIKSLSIWIADESAPGFDPFSLNSYTVNVWANQDLLPASTAANTVRPVDVTDFSGRYVLINLTSSFQINGAPFQYSASNPSLGRAQLGDITVVPEPHAVGLLMFGGAIALTCILRRKSLRW